MADHQHADREIAGHLHRLRENRCPDAFRELVGAFGRLVESTALRVTGDPEAARDIAQCVFADLHRLASSLDPHAALGGWLHRHTVFLSLRHRTAARRRRAREHEAARRQALHHTATPPDWLPELDRILDRLPEADRRALILRYLEGRPMREIGAHLGISEGAAQKRISRALDKLRAKLSGQGFAGLSTAALASGFAATGRSSAASLCSQALASASTSGAPAAGHLATLLAMNGKSALLAALAACLLTSGFFSPWVVARQNHSPSSAAAPPRRPPPPAQPPPRETAPTDVLIRTGWSSGDAAINARAAGWFDAVYQIRDLDLKENALAEMHAALESGPRDDALAALIALTRLRGSGAEFDHASFLPAVRLSAKHPDPAIRAGCVARLGDLGSLTEDRALLFELAGDPDTSVRAKTLHSLAWLSAPQRDLTDAVGDVILSILEREPHPTRSLIDRLSHCRLSPKLERKMVEFARLERRTGDEELPYYAVYSCLSTQTNKGPDCVDLLVEIMDHDDQRRGRAVWGLGWGVAPGHGSERKIADAVCRLIARNPATMDGEGNSARLLQSYGSSAQVPTLEALAAQPGIDTASRDRLIQLAHQLRHRPASP